MSHPHTHHAAKGSDPATRRVLVLALIITLGFAGVEAVVGWLAGSLALLGDAGHMVSDSVALLVALLAAWVGGMPPSERHSYGLGRMEVVAALGNGLLMIGVVVAIAFMAVQRLQDPRPVAGAEVVLVASLGLVVNLVVLYLLSRPERSLNLRGALLHVIGDLLGSLAALVSGLVILLTGWMPIDPLLSLFICALILVSALRLLRDVLQVILESVPGHLRLGEVGRAMATLPGVRSVHDLHIWTLSSGLIALSAHVVVDDLAAWPRILRALEGELQSRFGIRHITIQPESPPAAAVPLSGLRQRRRSSKTEGN